MTEQEFKILIDKKVKELILINIVQFIIFGEAGWRIIHGKTKLLK